MAYNFLNQRAGDPHFLSITSSTILTNHINGRLQLTYTDFTPLAVLLTEHIAFVVRADSPLKTGKDMIEALRKNPASLSIALGSAVGGPLRQYVPARVTCGGVMRAVTESYCWRMAWMRPASGSSGNAPAKMR